MEQAERVTFEEQQGAYLQEMFDAFQILQGTGVIWTNEKWGISFSIAYSDCCWRRVSVCGVYKSW